MSYGGEAETSIAKPGAKEEQWTLLEVQSGTLPIHPVVGMTPLDHPYCATSSTWCTNSPPWVECLQRHPQVLTPHGITYVSITDWSKSKNLNSQRSQPAGIDSLNVHLKAIPGSMFSTPQGMFHLELWKLVAAMGPVTTDAFLSL